MYRVIIKLRIIILVADSPTSLSNYLDSKQRGVTGAKRGAIKWAINRDVTFGEGETMKKYREVQGCTQCHKVSACPSCYLPVEKYTP